MEVRFSNIRCFVCFKRIQIPDIDSIPDNHYLYANRKFDDFRYYKYLSNENIDQFVISQLDSNQDWQIENDNTKGNKYKWLIGKMSNSDYEPILGFVKCPRCHLKFQSFAKKTNKKIDIEQLDFSSLDKQKDYIRQLNFKSQNGSRKSADYLFSCKNLFLASLHPFDNSKFDFKEYKQLIRLGNDLLKIQGIQEFMSFILESQYRVPIWTAKIVLENGGSDLDEILKINGERTIKEICLEIIKKPEISDLPKQIVENRDEWIKNVLQHAI